MQRKKCLIIYAIVFLFLGSLIIINIFLSKKQKYKSHDDFIIATYIDGEFSNNLPSKDAPYLFEKMECSNGANLTWDNDNWGFSVENDIKNTKCVLYFKFKKVFEYDYTGTEETYTVYKDGLYKIETWGAQGGTNGNYIGGPGGYSIGQISLTKDEKLYINVGGTGGANLTQTNAGGYNGGGYSGSNSDQKSFGGGGATHIATSSGLLLTLENNKEDILMVAGGGGGATTGSTTQGGAGGGFIGVNGSASGSQWNTPTYIPYGGTQSGPGYAYGNSTRQGKFGTGRTSYTDGWAGGGGGGYYGGSNGYGATGAGGSGYIGNSLLIYKAMYCYNCTQSNEEDTKTITTTCNEERPTENCAKKGNGYAKITYLGNVNIEYYADNIKIDKAPNSSTYNFNKIDCQNGSNLTWNSDKWEFAINDYQENDTCKIYFSSKTTIELAYTGAEEKIVIPKTGFYKLETWGAQGGSASSNLLGGSGGYSAGVISLSKNDVLYVNIGGGGNCSTELSVVGGYNGGGAAKSRSSYTMCSGGGATSITRSSGLLSSFSSSIDKILMVAGGGGGSSKYSNNSSSGGSGGGINGVVPTNACTDCGNRTGGSQTAGGIGRGSTGTFGQGGGSTSSATNGGGGGYYGGGGDSYEWGATGGSGYIGNSLLNNKIMYCYNCTESSETDTKTVSTTCNEETPTENCAKKGNGYAKITYLVNVNIEYYADNIKIDKAPNSSTYNFNKIDCQNGSNLTWDSDKWEFAINDYKENDTCKIYFSSKTTIELAYTGDAQEFIVPKTGVYKLEVWGAEGGSNNENDGGYGGYASGLISLARGDNLNIAIGGTTTSKTGGYNGGGAGGSGGGSYASGLGGGGATSITSSLINDGQLANYENNKDAVLIVAGGGGGVNEACATLGGSGGGMNGAKNAVRTDGYSGGNSNYGTQTSGYAFGQGQPGKSKDGYANCGAEGNGGGGGGYYGGFSYQGTGQYSNESGGGGSGYIGNSLLNNKIMYCYNCTESSETDTKTVSTTCNEETPTENCAKKGNGYAKITFIEATN